MCFRSLGYLLCIVLYSSAVNAGPVEISSNSDELILLNVLFRHGDRTPDLHEMYPNDPFNATSYFAEGLGQLTKKGKNREYEVGAALRQRYDQFLGPYESKEVSAISTDYIRTKMSCLLVLAGLYPPTEDQMWRDGLNWQPTPCDYNPAGSDYLLGEPLSECPRYRQLYDAFLNSEEGLRLINKRKSFYELLSQHTGLNMTIPRDPYNLEFVLRSEEGIGLKLPEWTEGLWPYNITDAGVDEYYVSLATPEMKRLAGGFFIKDILDNMNNKITNRQNTKKIHLYSAHENNLAYQLILLDIFRRHYPPYGSYIVYELRRVNGVHGVQVLYEDYTNDGPTYFKIPGCDTFCPLDKFTNILQKYVVLPEDSCIIKK